jgi:uncharacterized membrane protein YciS (DUF1049 family)
MQPLKIVISLISLIILAIAIGSNLSPIVTVTILSQPTIMLPVGVWLIIAIGLGLLSSSVIQLLIWLQNRTLTKKIRQLQTRLQEVGEDVFTYAAPPAEPPISNRRSSRDNFESSNSAPNFTTPPPVKPQSIDNSDDWEYAPVVNPQPEWEDSPPPPRQQTVKAPERSSYTPRQTFVDDNDLDAREGVYDADFRLIQPPYKAPLEVEEEEYEDEETDEYDSEDLLPSPPSTPKNDSDDEDWGFDFDEEATSQPKQRKS